MIEDKEIWLSRGEIHGLLQGTVTWADVCARTARPVRLHEPLAPEEGAREEKVYGEMRVRLAAKDGVTDTGELGKASEVRITAFLVLTAVITLVLWVYFVYGV